MQDKGLDIRNNKVIKLGEMPTPGQAISAPEPRQQALTLPDARRELATALNQKIHSVFSMANSGKAGSNHTAMQQGSIGQHQSSQQQKPPPQPQELHTAQPASSMQISCQQGSMQSCALLPGDAPCPANQATLPLCQTPSPHAASPEAAGAVSREGQQISLSMPATDVLPGKMQQHGARSAKRSGQAEQQEAGACPANTSRAMAQAQQPDSMVAGPAAGHAVTGHAPVFKPLLCTQAVQASAHAHAALQEAVLHTDSKSIPTPPQQLQPEALLAQSLLQHSDTL